MEKVHTGGFIVQKRKEKSSENLLMAFFQQRKTVIKKQNGQLFGSQPNFRRERNNVELDVPAIFMHSHGIQWQYQHQ